MEEVDNIIISSLKNINCDLDDDVHSLRDFTPEIVVNAVVSCLEAISPGVKLPRKLAPSMTLKLKLATQLAEQIKDLGYRDDMGYQTILYCNELEVRKVLMFLIERLPRDSNKTATTDLAGYVPYLIKKIEENVRVSLLKPWVPSSILKDGARCCGDKIVRQSYGSSHPLRTVNLEVPSTQNLCSEELRQYWVRYLPEVTKQCPSKKLLPSLLFKDNKFSMMQTNLPLLTNETEMEVEKILQEDKIVKTTVVENKSVVNDKEKAQNETEEKIEGLLKVIETLQMKVEHLNEEYLRVTDENAKVKEDEQESLDRVQEVFKNIKTKSRTWECISRPEQFNALKAKIDGGKEKMGNLEKQWNDIRSPLVAEIEALQENERTQQKQKLNGINQNKLISETNNQLRRELKDKEMIKAQLIEECARLPKSVNRSVYTKRILDLIGNIKKQNEGTEEVLTTIKRLQKEINSLSEKVDRSFVICDELIFREAKVEEKARTSYKILAGMQTAWEEVIQAVTDLGLMEREIRNLQEQYDAEAAKGTQAKLERVQNDLQEVRKEVASMLNHEKIQNV